jgi:hypothetical protein
MRAGNWRILVPRNTIKRHLSLCCDDDDEDKGETL